MIFRGMVRGISSRAVIGCAAAAGVLVAGVFAFGLRVSADSSLFWDDVTGALMEKTDEPGVAWKSWYQPHCQVTNAIVEDYGSREERELCAVSSAHAQLAVFKASDAGDPLYALKRDTDEVFHRVTILTPYPSYLTLLADDMILGASQNGADQLALYSLSQLQEHVVPVQIQTGYTTYNTVYTIDTSQRQIIRDDQLQKFAAGSIAVSKNGMFAVVQALGRGLVWVDLRTRDVKLITNDSNNGQNVALAVANDGNSVAVTGGGSTVHRIYTGIGGCGVSDVSVTLKNRKICHAIDLSNDTVTNQDFGTPYDPEFETNTKLVIHEWVADEQKSRRVMFTPDPDKYRLEYLAMGDSYTSGEGDVGRDVNGKKYYLAGTDVDKDDCHLSSRSYPFLLKAEWGITNSRMRSVACSGAQVLPDFYGNSANYPGQEQRLLKRGDITVLKQQALEKFTPGHVQQIEFVKKYQPKLVTLTGGGNDVGFADILEYCALPDGGTLVPGFGDCEYAKFNSNLYNMLVNAIDTQYNFTKQLIGKMQQASPTTKIVLIGYPSFIKPQFLCAPNGGTLSQSEATMINTMLIRMNSMLQRAAHDTDITYVDITDALNGGRICEGSKYMTGVLKNMMGQSEEAERFHPNAEGHKRIATAIHNADVYERDTAASGAGAYEPSTGNKITVKKDVVLGGATLKISGMEIRIPQEVFKPLSQFTITIHSDPTELGQFTTDADGSFSKTLSLNGVDIGRHVLVIDGVDPDDNPLQLFQFVEVKASDTDADGDGIPDDQDPCQYITQWYDEETGEDICAVIPTSESKLAKLSTASYVVARSVTRDTEPYNIATISDTHDHVQQPIPSERLTASSAHVPQAMDYRGVIGVIILLLLGVGSWIGYTYYKKYTHK